ncbi:MAG TPA: hypothetical protein D7I05_01530 [Candidatus Poseidoniales archaeon]|nr:MAG TPA: hypothetical protein D7I05_01530 [Candidatus Poseidoniales archaeon]
MAPLLRLSAPAAVGAAAMGMAAAAPQRDDSWWQDGQAPTVPKPAEPAPGSVEASSGAFWSSEATVPTQAASPSEFMMGASDDNVCGAVGCNRAVTDFDYRCFTCRKRFCMTHRGTGVDCPACAST